MKEKWQLWVILAVIWLIVIFSFSAKPSDESSEESLFVGHIVVRIFVKDFENAMEDDFNTADAITAISELAKFANTTADGNSSKEYAKTLFDLIVRLGDILGLILDRKEEMLDADIEALIEERTRARKEKNFQRADEIRDELLKKGIELKDTREGVQWKRV